MTTKTQNRRPLFRVSFSRITGKDENGQDVLGKAREIGAIWPRRNGNSGGILQLDIIPIELTQRQGVNRHAIGTPDRRAKGTPVAHG